MAPRRKKPSSQGREVKLRFPEDIMRWVEARAAAEARPMNRIIINAIASIPHLEQFSNLAELIGDMKVVLARQGERIAWADLQDELLEAIDTMLKSEGTAQQAVIDKIRVLRNAMVATDRVAKRKIK